MCRGLIVERIASERLNLSDHRPTARLTCHQPYGRMTTNTNVPAAWVSDPAVGLMNWITSWPVELTRQAPIVTLLPELGPVTCTISPTLSVGTDLLGLV